MEVLTMNGIRIKLIDGVFDPTDANEVVTDVITKKINFHTLKSMGSDERYGYPDKNSLHRITELKEDMGKMRDFISQVKLEGKQLKISATINFTIIE
jgi:hypothetical protein